MSQIWNIRKLKHIMKVKLMIHFSDKILLNEKLVHLFLFLRKIAIFLWLIRKVEGFNKLLFLGSELKLEVRRERKRLITLKIKSVTSIVTTLKDRVKKFVHCHFNIGKFWHLFQNY